MGHRLAETKAATMVKQRVVCLVAWKADWKVGQTALQLVGQMAVELVECLAAGSAELMDSCLVVSMAAMWDTGSAATMALLLVRLPAGCWVETSVLQTVYHLAALWVENLVASLERM